MSQSNNWKNAEHSIAKTLNDNGVAATRISRAGNWGKSTFDVAVDNLPNIKIDSKYSKAKPFRNHGLVKEIEHKYCKEDNDKAVLYTKNYKEHGGMVTIRAEFFAELLSLYEKHHKENSV